MYFDWYSTKSDDSCFGLFSTISGGTVRNLIIDNANAIRGNNSALTGAPIVGILAGAVYQNSNIQNIIIHNSDIKGASSAFNQNEKWVIAGGAIGKIVDTNNNYKFDNISTNVNIDLSSLSINNSDIV